jgi:hypothetical protein
MIHKKQFIGTIKQKKNNKTVKHYMAETDFIYTWRNKKKKTVWFCLFIYNKTFFFHLTSWYGKLVCAIHVSLEFSNKHLREKLLVARIIRWTENKLMEIFFFLPFFYNIFLNFELENLCKTKPINVSNKQWKFGWAFFCSLRKGNYWKFWACVLKCKQKMFLTFLRECGKTVHRIKCL